MNVISDVGEMLCCLTCKICVLVQELYLHFIHVCLICHSYIFKRFSFSFLQHFTISVSCLNKCSTN